MHAVAHGGTDRDAIARGLTRVLADTRALQAKTRRFARDAGGLASALLRPALERQGVELEVACELLTERVGSPGRPVLIRSAIHRPLAHRGPHWRDAEMVSCLVATHEAVGRRADRVLKLAEHARDWATCDLLTQRIDAHETTAWKLVPVGIVALVAELLDPRPSLLARRDHFARVSGHA